MRVLVIEDEKKLASFIARGMQQEGYAVDVVYDGAEGSYQVLNFEYDVVILDLMLPQRSGLDVLRAIRADKPKVFVLILTARGSPLSRDEDDGDTAICRGQLTLQLKAAHSGHQHSRIKHAV